MNLKLVLPLLTVASCAAHRSNWVPPPSLEAIRSQDLPPVALLDAPPVSLRELLGNHRPVVIHFWATWCAPCQKEVPQLVELAREHTNLNVIGLTIEREEDAAKVREFSRKWEINYRIGFASPEVYQLLCGQQQLAVPRLLVYAADGHLVQYLDRYYSMLSPYRLGKAVEEAVKTEETGR